MFGIDWNWQFYELDPCGKCSANVWRKDWVFAKKSGGRSRYECIYCGNDLYPGGAVNDRLAGISREPEAGAPDSASEALTDLGR